MLKNFENWLLENNYSASTSADYMGRIERLCRKEEFTLAYLVENIASILPQYETAGEKSSLRNLSISITLLADKGNSGSTLK